MRNWLILLCIWTNHPIELCGPQGWIQSPFCLCTNIRSIPPVLTSNNSNFLAILFTLPGGKGHEVGNKHFWFHGTELREGLRTVWREVGSNVWSTHTGKNWPSLQPAQMWEAKAGWVPCAPPAPLLPAAVVPFPCLGNPGPGANLNLESEVRRVPEPELAVSLCKIASLSTYCKLRNYLTSPPSAHHIWNPTTRQLMPVRLAMPRPWDNECTGCWESQPLGTLVSSSVQWK